jgi:hypothetical protein
MLWFALAATASAAGSAERPVHITLSGSGAATAKGGRHDGFGAISGGGSTSRLLADYPEPQRSQVLDYLFLPGHGASLQVLKVEIGGDTQSTDGSEPSHQHARGEQPSYQRGWEWWLMHEAKQRNPNIRLGALAWGAPGWLGSAPATHVDTVDSCVNFTCTESIHLCNCNAYSKDASGSPVGCVWNKTFAPYCPFFSRETARYLVSWLQGAKAEHGLEFDFIGMWNERQFTTAFTIMFREALDAAGFQSVRLVATDNGVCCNLTQRFLADYNASAELRKAVDVVGIHYPSGDSAAAHATGLPVWAAEDWSGNASWAGAASLASSWTSNWAVGRRSAAIAWSAIAAWYPTLPHYAAGLMVANEPWSGAYEVAPPIWAAAHFTQLTALDDILLAVGDGSGTLPDGYGAYIGVLRGAVRDSWSWIGQSMDAPTNATSPLQLCFSLSSELRNASQPVRVWRTSRTAGQLFQREKDIAASADGTFSITLQPHEILSLTTGPATEGHDTHPEPPAAAPFPCPWAESFDRPSNFSMGRWFQDQMGSFEVLCAAPGNCSLVQMAPTRPIEWSHGAETPLSVVGDPAWSDIEVNITVALPAFVATEAFMCARVGATGDGYNDGQVPPGYCLRITSNGTWGVLEGAVTLATGSVSASPDRQYHLRLKLQGLSLTASIDDPSTGAGKDVAHLTAAKYHHGQVAIGCSWAAVRFDDVKVAKAPASLTMKHDDASGLTEVLLAVQTDSASGIFTLMLNGSVIAESSTAGLQHKGTAATSGSDALGSWRGTRTEWLIERGLTPVVSVAKAYDSGDVVAFEQHWPAGYRPPRGVTQGETAPSFAFPSFAPCKGSCAQHLLSLPFVSLESFDPTWGTNIGGVTNSPAKVFGAYRAGPILFMANSSNALPNAVVISSTDHFHVASAATNSDESWGWGIAASVALPPGTNFSTVLVAGRGPTQAMHRWGHGVIRQLAGTDRREAKGTDVAMTHIGYWADNGGYYNMNKMAANTNYTYHGRKGPFTPNKNGDPSVEALLMAEISSLRDAGIAIKYLQLDDWYYNGYVVLGAVNCVQDWEARSDWFPHGLKWLSEQLDSLHIMGYIPWICNTTKYSKASGGQFDFVSCDPRYDERCIGNTTGVAFPTKNASTAFGLDCPWPESISGGQTCAVANAEPAPHDSYAFYAHLFELAKADLGVTNFEQDFTGQNAAMYDWPSCLTCAEEWLTGQHRAAEELKMPMQYCLSDPASLMLSSRLPWVTNARASGDYTGCKAWDIGTGGLLHWAMDVGPFHDVMWTSTFEAGDPYTNSSYTRAAKNTSACIMHPEYGQPNVELDALISAYSKAPVGIGDGPRHTNIELARSTCMKDGRLLQPDKLLSTLDRRLYLGASGLWPPGIKSWQTAQGPGGGSWVQGSYSSIDGMLWHYILAVTVSPKEAWELQPIYDFYPPPEPGAVFVQYVLHQPLYDATMRPCRDGDPAFGATGCARRLRANETAAVHSAHGEVRTCGPGVPEPCAPAGTGAARQHAAFVNGSHSISLRCFAPVLSALEGWILLGEIDKLVPISGARVTSVATVGGCLAIGLLGSAAEEVHLAAISPAGIVVHTNTTMTGAAAVAKICATSAAMKHDDHDSSQLMPTLTPFQQRFLSVNRVTATAADARARPALLAALGGLSTRDHLRSVRGLDPTLLALPASRLLERLERELAANEVLHSFDASVATLLARGVCSNCADTDLTVECKAKYLHNVWELPLLGDRCTPPPINNSLRPQAEACGTEDWLLGCDLAETDAFCQPNHTLCFPPFSSQRSGVNHQTKPLRWPASWAEAIERPVYHSSNFHRSPGPVSQFGSVTFVMNRSLVDPLSFVFPVDSGDFEGFCSKKNAFEGSDSRSVHCAAYDGEMGAPGALSHSVLAWAGYLNKTAGTKDAVSYNLANLIAGLTLPWNHTGRPVASFVPTANRDYDQEEWYWEQNTVGPLPYPQAVTMVVASYAELFGSRQGAALRQLCTRWGWPLAWALGQPPSQHGGENGGWMATNVNRSVARLLDPVVLRRSPAGHNLSAAVEAAEPAFADAWTKVAQSNENATGWTESGDDWDALVLGVMGSGGSLAVEPLRAGQCEGQHTGRCVGVSGAGNCVCHSMARNIAGRLGDGEDVH